MRNIIGVVLCKLGRHCWANWLWSDRALCEFRMCRRCGDFDWNNRPADREGGGR